MLSIFNNLIAKTSKRLKEKNGMTLIEVVVAFLIIAIVSTVLVRGTITAVNTMRINKSKTEALAIANEKIEIIKAIDYSEIIITEEDDEDNPNNSSFWTIQPTKTTENRDQNGFKRSSSTYENLCDLLFQNNETEENQLTI